jgi:serine/threonine protein kinase
LLAREVKAASALRHPSAVTIYDCGEASDGSPYFAMEFLPGLSLAGLVGRFGPMPAGRAIYLGRQLCGVLDEAHRRGLIHRDLSPSNVFACVLGGQCDVAKLLDFGVVAVTGEATDLAASGRVAGTPEYLAPEQAVRGGAIDGRADVYGLGGLLVFLLTGRPPYEGETPQAVLEMQVSEPLETVESLLQEVPDDLKAVILRCLAKQPDERFPTADAVAAALRSCQAATTWDAEEAVGWWRAHIDG